MSSARLSHWRLAGEVESGAEKPLLPPAQRFHKRFRHCPVVLPCLPFDSVQTAAQEAIAAIRAGANGVFFEWDRMDRYALHDLTRQVRSNRPRAWIGLTCRSLTEGLIESVSDDVQGLCIRAANSIPETELADASDTLRKWQEWEGLLFGGLDLSDRDLRDHTATAVSLSRLVDIVLLEMPALDNLYEVSRVKTVKHGLGNFPVGVAADLSLDCVDPLACMVECLLPCRTKGANDVEALARSVRACQHP